MNFRKTPFKLYVGLSVWSGLAYLFPTLFTIFSFFTLGLSSLIPTIWLYATLLLPVLLIRSNTPLSTLLKVASVILAIVVSYKPGQIQNAAIDREIEQLTKGDFITTASRKHKHILLVENYVHFEDRNDNSFSNAKCDKFCQRYLLNGDIATVTVHATDQYNKSKQATATYGFEKRERCPNIWNSTDDAIVDVALKVLDGFCVVHLPEAVFTEGLIVEKQHVSLDEHIFVQGINTSWAVRLFVSERVGNLNKPLAQVTSIQYTKANGILTISTYGSLFSTVSGWQTGGSLENNNPQTTEEFIEKYFQIKATPPPKKDGTSGFDVHSFNIIAPETTDVVFTMEDKSPLPFEELRIQAIGGWMERLPSKLRREKRNMSLEEVTLLKKIVGDLRMGDLSRGNEAIRHMVNTDRANIKLIAERFCKVLSLKTQTKSEELLSVILMEARDGSSNKIPQFRPSIEITAQVEKEYCS
jgi:hypothetical protein